MTCAATSLQHLLARFAAATLVLCAAAACSGGDGGPADAGGDTRDDDARPLAVELGVRSEHGFAELPPNPALEVVSGFQGGFHIEPALRIEEPTASEFITVVDYTVTDVDSGQLLTDDPFSYRVGRRAWNREPGAGYSRTFEQVILDVSEPRQAAGRTVRVEVRVEVEDPFSVGTDAAVVELVDEDDELAR